MKVIKPTKPSFPPDMIQRDIRRVCINIWDDYHDDGDVPKGEIQETHAYVESVFFSAELKNDVLMGFLPILKKLSPNKKTEFDVVDRGNGEHEIAIKHLSHVDRLELLRRLKKARPKYQGVALEVISES